MGWARSFFLISVSCHVKWDLFWDYCEVRGQNIYLKTSQWRLYFLYRLFSFPFLCASASGRLFCDRISLFPVFCAPQWHFYYFYSHFDSMSVREIIAWSQQRTKWPWPLIHMCCNSLGKKKENGRLNRIMDHCFDQLLSLLLCSFI